LAKPEWGLKRTCPTCSARFYDLRRETITCPVCETVYDPDRLPKPKRGGPVAREEKVAAPVRRPVPVEDDEEAVEEEAATVEIDELEEAGDDEAETEEGDLIEDTSDLGEDDDDIGEVMEHVDEDEDKP
jgi:uncharacterized protein (TIGR02300 family)